MRKVLEDSALLLRNSVDARDDHVIDIEAPQEPVWYDGDETEVRQVLWSLGTNGLRAMSTGGRLLLTVRLDTRSDGNDLVLVVQDHGCGIPAEEIDHVFQPFRSSFVKGTGLGLAIVHRIVTDYGGTIQVASLPGEGTTVSVRLPVAQTPMAVEASREVLVAPRRTA